MSAHKTGSTNTAPKTDVNSAGGIGKPGGSTGYREPGLKRMETTTLFRVTNFELFVKPVGAVENLSTKECNYRFSLLCSPR